jgi:adhesin transport system membrane fusion protein
MLEARLIRLKAEADRRPELQFAEGTRADLTATERNLFEKRRNDYMTTEAALKGRLDLAKREEGLLQEGMKSRAISPVELIRVQKEIAELQGSLGTLHSAFERQAMEQFDKDRAELEALVQAIKRDKDRLDRTVIRSPVRGVVNKIYINTVGRVVGSGADIMAIVPSDDTLLIEANIGPADIAFIRPGEKANVKFTAYDFSRYGGLDGVVERIGVDTVTDEASRQSRQGQPALSYYPIMVRTEKNSLGKDRNGRELAIIPGMVVEVDILTGKKTVLNYLLMPLNRARERALRER